MAGIQWFAFSRFGGSLFELWDVERENYSERVFPGGLSERERLRSAAELNSTNDEDWMGEQKLKSILGSERFVRLVAEQGTGQALRGRIRSAKS